MVYIVGEQELRARYLSEAELSEESIRVGVDQHSLSKQERHKDEDPCGAESQVKLSKHMQREKSSSMQGTERQALLWGIQPKGSSTWKNRVIGNILKITKPGFSLSNMFSSCWTQLEISGVNLLIFSIMIDGY